MANEIGIDNFSSDDEEDGVMVLDDFNGSKVEFGDDVLDDDAWSWKSVSS